MAPNLQAIKAALQTQENKAKLNTGDNASYRFWDIPDGSTALLRFLPDADDKNPFFWLNKESIKLPFAGVDDDLNRTITIGVPCVEMYGDSCPILALVRPWWKDKSKEPLARQYWKKKSYLFQGFVVNSPYQEEVTPENPIRRFIISPSIFTIIKNSLMNAELEDSPTDEVGGRDFKLSKTKVGGYANYSSSAWSMKTRSLSEGETNAIAQFGLWDLKAYLGRKPDKAELDVMVAMFNDSVAGRPFDTASYGQYYRPYGDGTPAVAPAKVVTTPELQAPCKPQDILQRIKNRSRAA